MAAGGRQPESGRPAAIRVRFGIDVGAGVQQHLRDFDNVLRRFLAEILDSVGRDVMQQCRAMLAHRTNPHEFRMRAEQVAEPGGISGNDRIRGDFEIRYRRISARQTFEMRGELGPACEPVHARDEELRVG